MRIDPAYREESSPHSPGLGLAALAARQHGVVTLAQLSALGHSRSAISRRVAAGRLHRLHLGLYAVGHVAVTADGRDLAAVLACGPGALLSHRSAAVHWLVVRHAPRYEVTVTEEDSALLHGIPVTSPARTLVDLADVLSEQRLADAVHEAEVQRILRRSRQPWRASQDVAAVTGFAGCSPPTGPARP